MRLLPKNRFSIHQKVFFSFASILLLSVIVTLFFGNSMMERLYIHSKSNDLSDAYYTIISVLEEQDSKQIMNQALWECFFEIEQNNIDILLLTLENEDAQIHYFTRKSWSFDNDLSQDHVPIAPRAGRTPSFLIPEKFGPNQWIEEASALGIFQDDTLPKLVTEKNMIPPDRNQTLDYYGCYTTDDNVVYIFLRTPKEAISLAAGLAVKYNLYIAIATFLLMAFTSYYISRKITQPIAEISSTANRISKMDFSQPLEMHTGDELEILSSNIDDMAKKLQDYIYQMQLNQELLEKDLEREAHTSRIRQEFIANVTHDFKTPLTLIRAYTETIRNQSLKDEERLHYCDIILNESERLNHMVTQLLQLSRLESGIVNLELSFFSMEEMIRDAIYRSHLLIQKKQITVSWEYDEEEHIVQGDYVRIEQVVLNLIDNAIKYTPEHGEITVFVKEDKNLCRITIVNTCEPLTEYQLENLFVSFYKKDESRHMEQQSFGLGLAIVKATMDLHHQTCQAYNAPTGLAVSFTLPSMQIDDKNQEE